MNPEASPFSILRDAAAKAAESAGLVLEVWNLSRQGIIAQLPEAGLLDRCEGQRFAQQQRPESEAQSMPTFVVIWPAEGRERLSDQVSMLARLARIGISPRESEELRLWVVAQPGASSDKAWQAAASELERDSYTCTKLVWLPPARKSEWAESAVAFVNRTFLARPWVTEQADDDFDFRAVSTVLRGKGKAREAELVDRLLAAAPASSEPTPEWTTQLETPLHQAMLSQVVSWLADSNSDSEDSE